MEDDVVAVGHIVVYGIVPGTVNPLLSPLGQVPGGWVFCYLTNTILRLLFSSQETSKDLSLHRVHRKVSPFVCCFMFCKVFCVA